MLVYDWLWWGQLANQNRAWRCAEGCTEVRGGVRRGVRGEVHGGVRGEVRGGVRGGARRGVGF